MDVLKYAEYITLVETSQMRKAAQTFFAPNFTIFKNNHEYSDMESFLRTKDFQHRYMRETVKVLSFYKGEEGFAVETMYGWYADVDIVKNDFV
jgi:hypothetical protein